MIKFRKLKENDERFGFKKGDIVVVETDYDWDPDKVICIGKLEIRNDNSFYKEQLEPVTAEELNEAVRQKEE